MACEVRDWKAVDCVLVLDVSRFSSRETFSSEVNELLGEGGALNANYRTVEAVAVVANLLGLHCLDYGKYFRFKTGGAKEISIDFRDEATKEIVESILDDF